MIEKIFAEAVDKLQSTLNRTEPGWARKFVILECTKKHMLGTLTDNDRALVQILAESKDTESTESTKSPRRICQRCNKWHRANPDLTTGKCQEVNGFTYPTNTCEHFEQKTT